MRYRIEMDGVGVAEFGPADQDAEDKRPWDQERAWDCFKKKFPAARQARKTTEPKIVTVE